MHLFFYFLLQDIGKIRLTSISASSFEDKQTNKLILMCRPASWMYEGCCFYFFVFYFFLYQSYIQSLVYIPPPSLLGYIWAPVLPPTCARVRGQ